MSARVLLNLSNEWGKAIKCEACQAFYRFFAKSLDKFIIARAQTLDSIYHVTLKLF